MCQVSCRNIVNMWTHFNDNHQSENGNDKNDSDDSDDDDADEDYDETGVAGLLAEKAHTSRIFVP